MKTILIATDFSEAATNALWYGADLAKFFGARLVLLHSFIPPFGANGSLAPVNAVSEVKRVAKGLLEDHADEIIKRIGFDPGIEQIVEVSSLEEALANTIKKQEDELVIIGMVGEGGPLKKHLIGSNALTLAQKLPVPLLVIPEHVKFRLVKKISIPCNTDGESQDNRLRFGAKVSGWFKATLEMVHIQANADKILAPAQSSSNEARIFGNIPHETVTIENEDAAEGLAVYFDTAKTDLIILSSKKQNFPGLIFHNGVIQKIIAGIKTPVLITHAV